MKEVKILGSGCAKCNQLADMVESVIAANGIHASVEKVDDIQQIVAYGVMATPALVVDGQVRCKGRVPTTDEVREMLTVQPHKCCCGDHAKGTGRQSGSCC